MNSPSRRTRETRRRQRVHIVRTGTPGVWVGTMLKNALQQGASTLGLASALLGATARAIAGPAEGDTLAKLKNLDLEELAKTEVTSVSRKTESIFTSPAAITVLSSEDIRRSGAENVAESLRLVPGLEVGRIGSGDWAITSRGFNSAFGNKLLVLMDGRSIYTPLFAGVYWDVQQVILPDLDRIEVIRGPGGTLWGANAVNGVINIMSKSAADTQGLLVSSEWSTLLEPQILLRYGGRINDQAHYRVYGEFMNHESSRFADHSDANDEWNQTRFGFRTDWEASDSAHWTVQGDAYTGAKRDFYTVSSPNAPFTEQMNINGDLLGANLLSRWTRSFSERSDLRIQAYWDHTDREVAIHRETRDTLDIDLQHRFPLGERHDVVWGTGFRTTSDDTRGSYAIVMNPRERRLNLYSLFLQDSISLIPDRLTLGLGSKLEVQNQTGVELQPSARLSFLVNPKQSLWTSVSRAVRSPSRADTDLFIRQAGPIVFPPGSTIELAGNPDLESEVLMAYEIGYRIQATPKLSLDLTAYYHDYERLIESAAGTPIFGSPILIPTPLYNGGYGEIYGTEIVSTWQVIPEWKLQASLTALQVHLHSAAEFAPQVEIDEGSSPQFQYAVRSWLDLPAHFEFDSSLQFVDSITTGNIPSHLDLGLRLGWHPTKHVEVSVGVRNLLDESHPEFAAATFLRTRLTEIPRTFYARLTLRW